MKDVIVSLSQGAARKILSGEKRYAYVRELPEAVAEGVCTVRVWCDAPGMGLVASGLVTEYVHGGWEHVWDLTRLWGGVSKEEMKVFGKGVDEMYGFDVCAVMEEKPHGSEKPEEVVEGL